MSGQKRIARLAIVLVLKWLTRAIVGLASACICIASFEIVYHELGHSRRSPTVTGFPANRGRACQVGYFGRLYSKYLDFVMRGWSWRRELARFFRLSSFGWQPSPTRKFMTTAMTFAFPLSLAERPGIDLKQNLERQNLPTDLSLRAHRVKDTCLMPSRSIMCLGMNKVIVSCSLGNVALLPLDWQTTIFQAWAISSMQEPAITNCTSRESAYTHFLVSLLISASQPFVVVFHSIGLVQLFVSATPVSDTRSKDFLCLPVTARSLTTNQSSRRLRYFHCTVDCIYLWSPLNKPHARYCYNQAIVTYPSWRLEFFLPSLW